MLTGVAAPRPRAGAMMGVGQVLLRKLLGGGAALALAALLVGCAAAKYRVERENVDCEDANAQVHGSLVRLGYEITRFDPATPELPGEIEARRPTPQGVRHGRVKIHCDGTTVFQPVEGSWFLPTFDFSRDVYYALLASVPRPPTVDTSAARPAPGPRPLHSGRAGATSSGGVLELIMRPLDRFEVRKRTGIDLTPRGVLVVLVEVVNGTSRSYALEARRIVLVDTAGERVRSLETSDIGPRLQQAAVIPASPAERPAAPVDVPAALRTLAGKGLASGRIAPGETRRGLLYFPGGEYRSGRLYLVDEETGEVEGTIVGF